MRITYKCKKCKNKLEITPNLDKTPQYLREIIVKSLLGLKDNDYCYSCYEKMEGDDYHK
ncbi:MAG: hypothetical protein MSA15_21425 [Clostridium sp.]|nr:hypothetical protein [Clostridium sp.]